MSREGVEKDWRMVSYWSLEPGYEVIGAGTATENGRRPVRKWERRAKVPQESLTSISG